MVHIPFPTNPLVLQPEKSPIPLIEQWLAVHQVFYKHLNKDDKAAYQKVRHNKNARNSNKKKSGTELGRTHLAAIAKVRSNTFVVAQISNQELEYIIY